ncbi:MAG: terminase large subunit domain-containing protein [Nitrososphaera sp.]
MTTDSAWLNIAAQFSEDPLTLFRPLPKQSQFMSAVFDLKFSERWYMGSNRSGKTRGGAYIGATIARRGFPWARAVATSGWVVSLDFGMSRDTVQPHYFRNGYGMNVEPFIPDSEIEHWSAQAQVLRLRNGSIIAFKSSDSGPEKFQGSEKDWVHVDEVVPRRIADEIAIRVPAGRRLIIFNTCTLLPPEGVQSDIHWVYEDIVKPWKTGLRHDIHVTNANIWDNAYIDPLEISRLEVRYPPLTESWRIRLNGELLPGIAGARVYSNFDASRNVEAHRFEDLASPIAWSWDFNVSPMISLLGSYRQGMFRVYREYFMDEGSIAGMCDRVLPDLLPGVELQIFGDATGRSRSAHSQESSYRVIENALSRGGFRYQSRVPVANPPVADRINAMNEVCRDVDGVARLMIDPSCTELLSDLEMVVYDRNNSIKKATAQRDPYRMRTHLSDALGYWVYREAPVAPYRRMVESHDRGRDRYKPRRGGTWMGA